MQKPNVRNLDCREQKRSEREIERESTGIDPMTKPSENNFLLLEFSYIYIVTITIVLILNSLFVGFM